MSDLVRRCARHVAFAAVPLLAACAALAPRIEPPQITSIAVRLDGLDHIKAQAFLGVMLEVRNPNPREIDLTGLDAQLTVEGEPAVIATLAAPVHIPANGTARAELNATTGIDAILRAGAAALRRGPAPPGGPLPTLRYAIEGAAVIDGRTRVPFTRDGELGRPDRS